MSAGFRKYRLILLCLLIHVIVIPVLAQSNLPEKPILNYISVDTSTQKIVLNWNPSTSQDILYYSIYAVDIETFPVSGVVIDTVHGDVLTFEQDIDSSFPDIYSITATDSVGESLLSGDFHKPIKLSLSYDSCSQEMNLNWDKYIGWKGNLNGYRVLYNEEDGPFQQIALLDSSTLSFKHKGIGENTNYNYMIRAFDNQAKSSFSNLSSYYTYMPPPPAFVNLDYVSVLDDLNVEISFTSALSDEINDFRLMKASSLDVSFTEWTLATDLSQTPYTFTDQVPTQAVQAFYRVDVLNGCLNPISSSNIGTNILLSGTVEGSLATLTWNPYVDFEGGIEEYDIYRLSPEDEFELITSLGPSHNSYTEDVSMIGQDQMKGEISYQVIARETGDNPNGIQGESRSNEITIPIETQLFIPNAFSPNQDGMNDTFAPVLDFTPAKYRMLIYDRSGKMLFQTTDPYDGWDGTLNGSTPARQGVYIYHIEYTSYSGIREEKTGNLSLVNP